MCKFLILFYKKIKFITQQVNVSIPKLFKLFAPPTGTVYHDVAASCPILVYWYKCTSVPSLVTQLAVYRELPPIQSDRLYLHTPFVNRPLHSLSWWVEVQTRKTCQDKLCMNFAKKELWQFRKSESCMKECLNLWAQSQRNFKKSPCKHVKMNIILKLKNIFIYYVLCVANYTTKYLLNSQPSHEAHVRTQKSLFLYAAADCNIKTCLR